MLNPNNDRLDYGQILSAPDKYKLDFAIGTTYSLDLDALVGVSLALGLSEDTDSKLANNPIALLEALRVTGDKIALFCEAGQIHMPSKVTSLYMLLEQMVYQVKTPKTKGIGTYPSFHPKFWLIRYVDENKKPLYRIVVLSRNLTFDRSWDVSFYIDGTKKQVETTKNQPIKDFLRYMLDFAKKNPAKQKKIKQIINELSNIHFNLGDKEFEDFDFIPVGVPKEDGSVYSIKDYPLFTDTFHEVLIMSPFLSDEQIVRIINECIINPWYFLREVARIPDQGNPKGVPYLLNRANLAATWCFINGIDNYLVIPRQIGKTESTVANINWAFLFGSTNAEMMFLNITAERAIANLTKVKDQRALLPPYLQFKIAFDDDGKEIKGVDNTKTLKNASNGNSIVTKPSARGIESAERIGRGSSQVVQYYDEFEFISYIKTIMAAAGPAYSTASENAKRNNSIHCRILTSTPGDLDSQPGMDALEIIENTCKFSETFYDKPIEDVYDYIETNSINRIVYIEFQYQQLGKDEAWFNKVCAYLNGDKLKIQREIFLRRKIMLRHYYSNIVYETPLIAGNSNIIKSMFSCKKISRKQFYKN